MNNSMYAAFYGSEAGARLAKRLRSANGDVRKIAAALKSALREDDRLQRVVNGEMKTPPNASPGIMPSRIGKKPSHPA